MLSTRIDVLGLSLLQQEYLFFAPLACRCFFEVFDELTSYTSDASHSPRSSNRHVNQILAKNFRLGAVVCKLVHRGSERFCRFGTEKFGQPVLVERSIGKSFSGVLEIFHFEVTYTCGSGGSVIWLRSGRLYLHLRRPVRMGSQSRRSRMYDRKRTDQQGETSRAHHRNAEDRRRIARQRYADKQAAAHASRVDANRSRTREVPCSDRRLRSMVKETVDHVKRLSGRDVVIESRILSCFLDHPSMSQARAMASVMSQKEQQCVSLLLSNLAEGLQTVKGTHTQDDVISKKCTMRMCSCKNIIENRLGRASSRILKLNPRNIRTYAMGRAEVLDDDGQQIGKWAGIKPGRKQRSDTLPQELKDLVVDWWTKMTRVSPVAKHVLKRQNHAIHTLNVTQVNGEEVETRISQVMFGKLKPRWVRKEVDRNICCCKYHVELIFLKDTLNEIRSSHHGNRSFGSWRPRKCFCVDLDCRCCRSRSNDAGGQSEEGSQHQDTGDGSIPDGYEPTEPVTETTEVLSEATSDGEPTGTPEDLPMESPDASREPTEAVMESTEALMETGGDGDPPMEALEARQEPLETGNESTPDGYEPTEVMMESTEALNEPTGAGDSTMESPDARQEPTEAGCIASNNFIHQLRQLVATILCPPIHVPVEGNKTEYFIEMIV
ncbi:hypothetical protein R1sor_024413 [Riccia sorocarpa]|uniref:Uncharacterized protein n=1 Tax=Riccia sorocarpa TaxID=122646 RepID=A0ABD3GTF0_9MARC